jgi:hypothetical protein
MCREPESKSPLRGPGLGRSGMYRGQAERYKATTGMGKVCGRKRDEMDVTCARSLSHGGW